jgi:hypothetical protein
MTAATREVSVRTPATTPAGQETPPSTVRPLAAGCRGRFAKRSTAGEVVLAYLGAQEARLSESRRACSRKSRGWLRKAAAR